MRAVGYTRRSNDVWLVNLNRDILISKWSLKTDAGRNILRMVQCRMQSFLPPLDVRISLQPWLCLGPCQIWNNVSSNIWDPKELLSLTLASYHSFSLHSSSYPTGCLSFPWHQPPFCLLSSSSFGIITIAWISCEPTQQGCLVFLPLVLQWSIWPILTLRKLCHSAFLFISIIIKFPL